MCFFCSNFPGKQTGGERGKGLYIGVGVSGLCFFFIYRFCIFFLSLYFSGELQLFIELGDGFQVKSEFLNLGSCYFLLFL